MFTESAERYKRQHYEQGDINDDEAGFPVI